MSAQTVFSSLLDAYKRSELHSDTGLGIFRLSSCLTDLAEPSELLLATTVVSAGLTQADYLLSSLQLDHFRQGKGVATETEVRGRRGAYFTHATIELPGKAEYTWRLFADVDQDNADVIQTIEALQAIKPLCSGISRRILPPINRTCGKLSPAPTDYNFPMNHSAPPIITPTRCSMSCAAALSSISIGLRKPILSSSHLVITTLF